MLDIPAATMVLVRWTGNSLWQRLRSRIDEEWFILRLTYWSLIFNSLTSCNTAIDTALEPLFWFVDHFVKYLGPAFVIIVICLVLSVVLIFYVCLLPEKYAESAFWTVYHLAVGHWLLVNVTFHYFKAVFTNPGHPPENSDSKWKCSDDEDDLKIPEIVSICKKCISPKPPRAHHCSVCKTCVLKMDHHCPWLNNCVGHYNHRYFFLFCVYMWVGTMYVSISAYPVFKEHFLGSADVSISGYFYPIYMMQEMWAKHYQEKYYPNATSVMKPTRSPAGFHFHNFVLYEFLLCSAVTIALGLLMVWHARLISRGETSIEVHINKKEKKRLAKQGQTFHNPYSFGTWKNWQKFLGITHGRTFWRHVLLPSSHVPESDGLRWQLSNQNTDPSGLVVL